MRRIVVPTYGSARPTAFGCACPDCGSPLVVRIWLRLGECWNCGTRVELSAEEIRAHIQQLDSEQQETSPGPSSLLSPSLDDNHEDPASAEWWNGLPANHELPWEDNNTLFEKPVARRKRSLGEVPAWLASLLFHLLVAFVLALLSWRPVQDYATITLALEVG